METLDRVKQRRNEHLTFRSNLGAGRHGWLRLTPAYGVRLVRERIAHLPEGQIITDPFSGTGTTPLAAAELGHVGQSVDVNPFLIWLGNAKLSAYASATIRAAADATRDVVSVARAKAQDADLWQPNLFHIEKWWSAGTLGVLKALRHAVDQYGGQVKDLLEIGLCRSLISCSNAAFNHQSMSFKGSDNSLTLFDEDDAEATLADFACEMEMVLESARCDLPGSARVYQGDSRACVKDLQPADLVLTSPPYVNRMSYVRELRPYMYWLRFLDAPSDAGDLDWRTIGGTWGTATSKLTSWKPVTETPVDEAVAKVCGHMREDGGKNGCLLAAYVLKYHHDMWRHFQAITCHVKPGGRVSYIIGNSTFYGHEIPAQEWFATMLRELEYRNVKVAVIRKRNSNKALFEYEVTGARP